MWTAKCIFHIRHHDVLLKHLFHAGTVLTIDVMSIISIYMICTYIIWKCHVPFWSWNVKSYKMKMSFSFLILKCSVYVNHNAFSGKHVVLVSHWNLQDHFTDYYEVISQAMIMHSQSICKFITSNGHIILEPV